MIYKLVSEHARGEVLAHPGTQGVDPTLIDADRIGVGGQSAGGGLAAATGAREASVVGRAGRVDPAACGGPWACDAGLATHAPAVNTAIAHTEYRSRFAIKAAPQRAVTTGNSTKLDRPGAW
jgi:cephalosporin-C deacetylase-like acetyl esterase